MAATAQLIVRLDPAEKQRVAHDAKRSASTISDYVRGKLFRNEDGDDEAAVQRILTELRPMVRKALRAIDADVAAIAKLREQSAARAEAIAQRTRQEFKPAELLAIAGRLDLQRAPARAKAR